VCGIAGYHHAAALSGKAMLRALAHRGPDSQGTHEEEVAGQQLFLGHARLSIVDLSENGHQPMHGEKSIISYNGEVYNFKALRQQHFSSKEWKSQTDTETILALYEKLGDDFVRLLNGAFAISIFDAKERKVKLFRDRMGIKPLYVHTSTEGIVFASEVQAILAAGIPAELDRTRISDFLVFKYSPGKDTLFKGIERLPAAHRLIYDCATKRAEVSRWWEIGPAYGSYAGSFKQGTAELKERLGEAVDLRLMSDVPLSNFLSGGIDSSIIAHHLRHRQDIHHYCAIKEERHIKAEGTTSDGGHARRLADAWGLTMHEVALAENTFTTANLSKVMGHNDDLIADGSLIPSYLITERAAQDTTVVLSGMGADEILLGYGGHLMTLASKTVGRLPSFMENGLNGLMGGLKPGTGRFKAYKRYLFKLGRYAKSNHRYVGMNVVGDIPSALSVYDHRESRLDQIDAHYFGSGGEVFEGLARFEMENFLQKNLLYMDRMSMANGMEGRVPFMDHNVVEFAHSLPRHFKLSKRFTTKHVLKEAYREELPAHILQRRKAGFGMPLRVLLADDSQRAQFLNEDFFGGIAGFDVDAVRQAVVDLLNKSLVH